MNITSLVIKCGVTSCRDEICQEDWVEIYHMYKDGSETRVGRYCGLTAPGPIESVRGANGIKVFFRTDEKDVYSGFKARYSFEAAKSIFGGELRHSEDGRENLSCDSFCYFDNVRMVVFQIAVAI